MMEGLDYVDDDLFHFDNDEEAAAAMDQLNDNDDDADFDADPVTPYGSAGPSAPPTAAHTGPASGRLHLSSAQVWQHPDHSSPPPLTYSPSPRTTSSFQHRHQDGARQQRQRHSLHRNSSHDQRQLSRQGSAQCLEQNFSQLSNRISDLSLRQEYRDQPQYDNRAHHPPASYEQDPRLVPSTPCHDFDQSEDRVPRQLSFYDVKSRHARSDTQEDYQDSELAPPEYVGQVDDHISRQRTSHNADLPPPRSMPQADREAQDLTGPTDEQEYVQIPADEVLDIMYNGDEESQVTAQKIMDQAVHAVHENGRVVYLVGLGAVQWLRSPEMAKRRRAAQRKMLDAGGQVVSGGCHVIMTSTPLGRVCDSVTTNVNAFRAAPFSYTMQGLGIMRSKNSGATPALPSSDIQGPKSPEKPMVVGHGKGSGPEPAIADGDESDFGSDYDEDSCVDFAGMFNED